jgi:hypothetical protein
MFELKPISKESIPKAVAKAERYRLLNEPQEAESICRDILAVDADNQEVLVMLLLAITDQFGKTPDVGVGEANAVLGKLNGDYERAYYAGIVSERWIKAQLRGGTHPSMATGWFLEAMELYRKATALSPPGNNDAILRWNACVRFQQRSRALRPHQDETPDEAGFLE